MSFDTYGSVVRELYPHANDICRAIGINPTADDQTAAERWLLALRDSFIEDIERILTADYPDDAARELEAVPVGTYEQWQVWTELKLWQYDPDSAVMESGEFMTRDFHNVPYRAVKFEDIPGLAESYEYEIAGNALSVMLNSVRQAYDNALAEADAEEE